MGSLYCLMAALVFLLAGLRLLDRHKWARYITRPVKRVSWVLAKAALKLLVKLLRKVTSLFDPY